MNDQKKILIIDDDARNIFALSAVLKAKGYICVSALSAMDGINKMKNDPSIAILLIDIMMPDMDGYAAIIYIRNLPEIASMPIIAVTAKAMQGDKEKCLVAGANEYISKPIDIPVLIKSLNKYLR
jgi:two-component system cell cycle response regulator DivK